MPYTFGFKKESDSSSTLTTDAIGTYDAGKQAEGWVGASEVNEVPTGVVAQALLVELETYYDEPFTMKKSRWE